jgi:hypothetical protein
VVNGYNLSGLTVTDYTVGSDGTVTISGFYNDSVSAASTKPDGYLASSWAWSDATVDEAIRSITDSTEGSPMGGDTCNHCGARREWTSSESSASYRKDGRQKTQRDLSLIGYRCGTVVSKSSHSTFGKDGLEQHNDPWTVDVRGDACK